MDIKYYESHVTIEPVFDGELERFKSICKKYRFQVADLIMKKQSIAPEIKSDKDSFCTARDVEYDSIHERMCNLVLELRNEGFDVYRMKIEAVLFDERFK